MKAINLPTSSALPSGSSASLSSAMRALRASCSCFAAFFFTITTTRAISNTGMVIIAHKGTGNLRGFCCSGYITSPSPARGPVSCALGISPLGMLLKGVVCAPPTTTAGIGIAGWAGVPANTGLTTLAEPCCSAWKRSSACCALAGRSAGNWLINHMTQSLIQGGKSGRNLPSGVTLC